MLDARPQAEYLAAFRYVMPGRHPPGLRLESAWARPDFKPSTPIIRHIAAERHGRQYTHAGSRRSLSSAR